MRHYAIILIGFYVLAKLLVRWWLYRPAHVRPGFVRHNETLRLVDLAAVLALIAAFFILINSDNAPRTILVTVLLLLYDVGLWALFVHLEVKRLCASSRKWTYQTAHRQVRRRARNPLAP